jgi:hypothetical protein
MRMFGSRWLVVGCAGWLLTIGTGTAALWHYAGTPGPNSAASDVWPEQAETRRSPDVPTLMMFAHPRCPCSRASIGELAKLMARVQERVRTHVLFYRPATADQEWERTDLWEAAQVIPGVLVHTDEDGREAQRFRAFVSGQTLLYDHEGRLLFNGGITAARGHSGDNDGRSSLTAILHGRTPGRWQTPVFGCFLFDSITVDASSAGLP